MKSFLFLTLLVLSSNVVLDTFADESLFGTQVADEFDGGFDLDWHIVREDEDGYSLETNPGELTLLTLQGSIWNSNETRTPAKNIFLLNQDLRDAEQFSATLHVSSFVPQGNYHQVGIIFYADDANYYKVSLEIRPKHDPPYVVLPTNEMNNTVTNKGPSAVHEDGPFWIRLTRNGDTLSYAYSNDGDEFQPLAEEEWKSATADGPIRIGFLAKKGPSNSPPDLPAVIESFVLETH